ncbi:helix-turn-helix domain-containing protein [Rhodococcus pyridinivorans]|uniref:helix-turn-helix domain-containing protein n=1 Tax=Rhodococcus pyridinivorans TaxID=103816 RepID=UPI00110DA94B|nr:helix-turn-helix transcriptional regulator [Rhodococcus pyridinivorans]
MIDATLIADKMISIAYACVMAEKKNPLGPSGVSVAQNIRHLREGANLTYAELGRKLESMGRPIPTLGLRKIESFERRVDADDLVALALALDVTPATLLMPKSKDWQMGSVQLTDTVASTPQRAWEWLTADYPLQRDNTSPEPTRTTLEFRMRARPEGAELMSKLGFSPEGRERRTRSASPTKPAEWVGPDGHDGDD